MDFIKLNTAIAVTGLSKRTLWRRIADGVLRTDSKSGGENEPSAAQTRVALDDTLALAPLRPSDDDRTLILQADAGVAEAQCDLGLLLLAQGRPADALAWLERAAQQGHVEGMHWLGRCHLAGQGVPADERLGMDWIARAANHGHAGARQMVPLLYDPARATMSPEALDAELDRIEQHCLLQALQGALGEPAGTPDAC